MNINRTQTKQPIRGTDPTKTYHSTSYATSHNRWNTKRSSLRTARNFSHSPNREFPRDPNKPRHAHSYPPPPPSMMDRNIIIPSIRWAMCTFRRVVCPAAVSGLWLAHCCCRCCRLMLSTTWKTMRFRKSRYRSRRLRWRWHERRQERGRRMPVGRKRGDVVRCCRLLGYHCRWCRTALTLLLPRCFGSWACLAFPVMQNHECNGWHCHSPMLIQIIPANDGHGRIGKYCRLFWKWKMK